MDSKQLRNKIILTAALTGLVSGATLLGSSHAIAGGKSSTEKGDHHKCAKGKCGDKMKKKCEEGKACKEEHAKKKGHKMKCADGSCGGKKGK